MRLSLLAAAAAATTAATTAPTTIPPVSGLSFFPTSWEPDQVFWVDFCTKSVTDCCHIGPPATPETSKCPIRHVEGDTTVYDAGRKWFKTTTRRTDVDTPWATQHLYMKSCCQDQEQVSCSHFYYKKPKTGFSRLNPLSWPRYEITLASLWVGNGTLYLKSGWGEALVCHGDEFGMYFDLEGTYSPAPTWNVSMREMYTNEWYNVNGGDPNPPKGWGYRITR